MSGRVPSGGGGSSTAVDMGRKVTSAGSDDVSQGILYVARCGSRAKGPKYRQVSLSHSHSSLFRRAAG